VCTFQRENCKYFYQDITKRTPRVSQTEVGGDLSVGYVLYSLHVCVWVTSDMKTTSDDPSSSALCVMCTGRFPRGVPGGGRYAPPWLRTAFGAVPQNFFLGVFLLFLADFSIFSGFVN
jgi:hypothetical protein